MMQSSYICFEYQLESDSINIFLIIKCLLLIFFQSPSILKNIVNCAKLQIVISKSLELNYYYEPFKISV